MTTTIIIFAAVMPLVFWLGWTVGHHVGYTDGVYDGVELARGRRCGHARD